MSRKALVLLLGTLVIVVVVIILIVQNSASNSETSNPSTSSGQAATSASSETTNPNSTTTTTSTTTTSSTSSGQATQPSGYTMAQVATHNNASSCWTAINGNVYNVTTWINQHPGGRQAILSLCGTDGSAAFNGQHGGQARPASELASFKIGALIN